MKNYSTKLLIISLLFRTITVNADWFVEKNIHSNEGLTTEKIWVKDSIFKIQQPELSIVFNFRNNTILFESLKTHLNWQGSFSDFFNSMQVANQRILVTYLNQFPEKKWKEVTIAMNPVIKLDSINRTTRIIPTKNFIDYGGLICLEYDVYSGDKKVESFYYTDQIKLYRGVDIQMINLVLDDLNLIKNYKYFDAEKYKSFADSGLIIRSEAIQNPEFQQHDIDVVLTDNSPVDPTYFNPTTGYQPTDINELLYIVMSDRLKIEGKKE